MHITDIHIVIGQKADGTIEQTYLGRDAIKANAAYYDAKGFTEVGLASYPAFTSRRFPLDEKAFIDNTKESSVQVAAAEKAKKLAEAATKRAAAGKLLEEAEKLHPTAQPETQPSASSPASSVSEPAAETEDEPATKTRKPRKQK